MKVFVSWSKDRSHAVAQYLTTWLKLVVQSLDPWISSRDIQKGSLWDPAIGDELKESPVGIICLTKDNVREPWILFEAGALYKGAASNRVCTFLIDLQFSDVEPPLAKFNHTHPTKNDMWELVKTLNSLTPTPLTEPILKESFETYWPKFEAEFSKILKASPPTGQPRTRPPEELLAEVLDVVRAIDRKVSSPPKTVFTITDAAPMEIPSTVDLVVPPIKKKVLTEPLAPTGQQISDALRKVLADLNKDLPSSSPKHPPQKV
jgi:hypothetical protein